jgi:glycosyltransferase involved in cell wall biosynthesis
MLTPYLPYPLLSGGQIRTYNLLKNLSRKHQITLFSYIRNSEEKQYREELLKYCREVYLFERRQAWSWKNILLAGFTPYPFLVCLYLSPVVKKAIAAVLKKEKYDLIHVETFYVSPQLPKTNLPILLVEQTIEWLVYLNYTKNLKSWILKPFLYFDVLKIKYWEKNFWKTATRLATVSEEDKKIITQTTANQNIEIVANGVDISFFSNCQKKKKSQVKTVLFVGNFKWLPNSDAAIYLVEKIWPKIKQEFQSVRLWIVGKNPTKQILSLQKNSGVEVKGDVADIRQIFSQADVMLAPIRNGRGTKYKVLEAIASMTPVVATPLGVEGLELRNGQEVLIGNTSDELASKTIQLLTNPQLGQQLARKAYQILKDRYNWKIISSQLDEIYLEMGKK